MASIVHWGKYYPPDVGGIETVTALLAEGTAASHQVSVVCFSAQRDPSVRMHDGVRIVRAPKLASVFSQPLGWSYFRTALREGRKADLVHLHAPNMLAALAAMLVGKGPKLFVHWHGDVVGKGLLGRLLRPLERAMLRRADRIICTSKAYAETSAPIRPFLHKVGIVQIGIPDVRRRLERLRRRATDR